MIPIARTTARDDCARLARRTPPSRLSATGVLRTTTTTAVARRSSSVAGSRSFQESARIWSTRMRTKLQRTQVTSRKTNIALSRNQTGPSHSGPGPDPARRGTAARRGTTTPMHVRVLAELDQRELHPRVLDAEAGDQLRLGLEDVERHAVLGRERRDDEGDEGELADHRIEDEPAAPACAAAMSDSCSEPASSTGTSAAKMNGRS